MDTCGSQLGASVDGLKTPSKTGRVQFAWWSHQAHWLRWLRVDVSWRLMEWWCVMQGEGIDIAPLASTVASASWRSFLKRPKTAQRWKSRDIALILFGKGSKRFELVPLLSSWLSRKVPGFSRNQGFPVAVEMVRHVTGRKKRSCKGHLSIIRILLITLGNRYRRLERLDPTEGPQVSSCILCLVLCLYILYRLYIVECINFYCFLMMFLSCFLVFQAQLQRALGGQIRETDWGHQSVDVCHCLSTQNLLYPTEICDEDA